MNDAAIPAPVRSHEKYGRLIAAAQKQATITAAVAHPCDDVSLRGAVEAKRLKLIEPILVGPVERLRGVASQARLDIGALEIVPSEHSHDSAAKAVGLVTAGKAEAKSLSFLAGAEAAGIVLGARVPIILTSRSDSLISRLAACAVAVLVAAARRKSAPASIR
jgi:phosphate acetyltransferase